MEIIVHFKIREGADFFRGVTDCRSSFCLSVFTSEKLHPILNICIYKTVSEYDEQDLKGQSLEERLPRIKIPKSKSTQAHDIQIY